MTQTVKKTTIRLKTAISGIFGGQAISDRDVGDAIIIDDIADTYSRFPGAGITVDKTTFVSFKNGFTEDLDMERKIEVMKGDIWRKEFGYAVVNKQGDSIQALHPRTYQQGFMVTEIDNFGKATEIQVQFKTDENADPVPIIIKSYDPNTGNGFFWLKAFRGLLGMRGLPHLLTLVDPLRVQSGLYLEYMKHAEWQAITHPVIKIKDLNPTIYERVKADIRAPDKDKAVIIDTEDDFYYDGPMAGAGAWDPTNMMMYGDKFVARETGLNMFQLTGDPMGYLSASESNRAEWFDAIKQYQAILLPQIKPILIALGLTDEVQFQEPYEPSFESKMESIKLYREALEGIVPIDQIVEGINKILGYEGAERLTPDPEYERRKELELKQGENDTESDKSQTDRSNED